MPCFVSITSSSSRQHLHHLITTSSSSLSFIKQLTTSIDRPATLRTLARRAHPAGPQIVFRHYDYDNSDEHVKEKKKKEEKNEQMPKFAYYAVAAGRVPGVYTSWAETEAQVKGYAGAKHKKFSSEAQARAWLPGGGGDGAASTSASGTGGADRLGHGRTGPRSNSSSARSIPTPYSNNTTAGAGAGSSSSSSRATRSDSPARAAPPASLPPNLQIYAEQGYTFSPSTPPRLVVYTDGSGLSNGQRGARAGLGVFWGHTREAQRHNLAERVPGVLQTNNRGELLSIIRALEACPLPELPLEVRTDSQYSIKCMTEYIPGWIKKGWVTSTGGPVKNADMIRHLLVLLQARPAHAPVRFKHVRGHVGHEGNEAADQLARTGAAMPAVPDRKWLTDADRVGGSRGMQQNAASLALARAPAAAAAAARTTAVPVFDVEIDPEWLLDEDEVAELEAE